MKKSEDRYISELRTEPYEGDSWELRSPNNPLPGVTRSFSSEINCLKDDSNQHNMTKNGPDVDMDTDDHTRPNATGASRVASLDLSSTSRVSAEENEQLIDDDSMDDDEANSENNDKKKKKKKKKRKKKKQVGCVIQNLYYPPCVPDSFPEASSSTANSSLQKKFLESISPFSNTVPQADFSVDAVSSSPVDHRHFPVNKDTGELKKVVSTSEAENKFFSAIKLINPKGPGSPAASAKRPSDEDDGLLMQTIDLSGCTISKPKANMLAQALMKKDSPKTPLNLILSSTKIKQSILQVLFFPEGNPLNCNLERIDLSANDLCQDSLDVFSKYILESKDSLNLKSIRLSQNLLKDDEVIRFLDVILNHTNVYECHLSYNELTGKVSDYLFCVLSKTCPKRKSSKSLPVVETCESSLPKPLSIKTLHLEGNHFRFGDVIGLSNIATLQKIDLIVCEPSIDYIPAKQSKINLNPITLACNQVISLAEDHISQSTGALSVMLDSEPVVDVSFERRMTGSHLDDIFRFFFDALRREGLEYVPLPYNQRPNIIAKASISFLKNAFKTLSQLREKEQRKNGVKLYTMLVLHSLREIITSRVCDCIYVHDVIDQYNYVSFALDLLQEYPRSDIFHNEIHQIVTSILETGRRPLLSALLWDKGNTRTTLRDVIFSEQWRGENITTEVSYGQHISEILRTLLKCQTSSEVLREFMQYLGDNETLNGIVKESLALYPESREMDIPHPKTSANDNGEIGEQKKALSLTRMSSMD